MVKISKCFKDSMINCLNFIKIDWTWNFDVHDYPSIKSLLYTFIKLLFCLKKKYSYKIYNIKKWKIFTNLF